MKNFYRTNLPESIKYNNLVYKPNAENSALLMQGISLNNYVKTMQLAGFRVIICNVLSKSLKSKTDLHNNPYKPTQWIFLAKKSELK